MSTGGGNLFYPPDWFEWFASFGTVHGTTFRGKTHGVARRPQPLYPADEEDRAIILNTYGGSNTCAKTVAAWKAAEDGGADEADRKKGFYQFSQCVGLTASKLEAVLEKHHYPERPSNHVPSRTLILSTSTTTIGQGGVWNCGPQENPKFMGDKKKFWENDYTDDTHHGHH